MLRVLLILLAVLPLLHCGGCNTRCERNGDCNRPLSRSKVCHSGECLDRECGGTLDVFGCGLFSRKACENGICVDPLDGLGDFGTRPSDDMGNAPDLSEPVPRDNHCLTDNSGVCDPTRLGDGAAVEAPDGYLAGAQRCEYDAWWGGLAGVASFEFVLASTDGFGPPSEPTATFAEAVADIGALPRVVSLEPVTFTIPGLQLDGQTLVLMSPCWSSARLFPESTIVVGPGATLVLAGVTLRSTSSVAIEVQNGGMLSILQSSVSAPDIAIRAEPGALVSVMASTIESGTALDMQAGYALLRGARFVGGGIRARGVDDPLAARLEVVGSVFEAAENSTSIDLDTAAAALYGTSFGGSRDGTTALRGEHAIVGMRGSTVDHLDVGLRLSASRAFLSGSELFGGRIGARFEGGQPLPVADDHGSLRHFPAAAFEPTSTSTRRFPDNRMLAADLETPGDGFLTSLFDPSVYAALGSARPNEVFPDGFELRGQSEIEGQLSPTEAWPALFVRQGSQVVESTDVGIAAIDSVVVLDEVHLHGIGGYSNAGPPDRWNTAGLYAVRPRAVFVSNSVALANRSIGMLVAQPRSIAITDTKFENNGFGGLWVTGGVSPASVTIEGTTLSGNGAFGALTEGTDTRILDTELWSSVVTTAPTSGQKWADGLSVADGTLILQDSFISGNDGVGLYLRDVTSVTLIGNLWGFQNTDADVAFSGTAPQTAGTDNVLGNFVSTESRTLDLTLFTPTIP